MAAHSCYDSFDSVFCSVCNTLTASGKIKTTSNAFSELKTDRERVKFVFNLAETSVVLPQKKCPGKSTAKAEEVRNKGNNSFKKKDFYEAIRLYSLSISLAPEYREKETNPLSLAFANRSAALFHLKKYADCIEDIDSALAYTYPKNLEYKLYERKGKCLQHLGDNIKAKDNFSKAVEALDLSDLDPSKQKNFQREFEKAIIKCNASTSIITQDTDNEVKTFPPPTFPEEPHQIFPSLCNAIEVVYTHDRGRYLVAKRDIKPGEIILIEKPFASVVLGNRYSTHCHHCFTRTLTSLPCTGCSTVMFCCNECRTAANETYHRFECGHLASIHAFGLDKFAHLALRTVARQPLSALLEYRQNLEGGGYPTNEDDVLRGCAQSGRYEWSEYNAIYHLVTHADDRTVADLFKRAVMALYLARCLQTMGYFSGDSGSLDTDENLTYIGGLILSHLQLLPCNAHEVSELVLDRDNVGTSTTQEIGAGIYATLSLFNHSCNPAVTRNFYQDTCVVRTIRNVRCGEEVSDNYGAVYEMQTTRERQQYLQPQYYFTCQCDACTGDWPTFAAIKASAPRLRCEYCGFACDRHPIDNPDVTCNRQLSQKDVKQYAAKLGQSEATFRKAFEDLLKCTGWNGAGLAGMLAHLEVLDRIVPPYQAMSSCQEAVKQCYNMHANCHLQH